MSRWAGVIHLQLGEIVLRDFWEASLVEESINVKEMWAVALVLESLPMAIRDCRVDVQVDNQSVLHTWMARRAHLRGLIKVAQRLFQRNRRKECLIIAFVRPIKK